MKTALMILLFASLASASYVVEWTASASYSSCVAYTSNDHVSYDVDGDSIPEVMLMDSSALKVYSGVTHNLLWSMPSGGYDYLGYPTIANTDGDAARELVFLAQSYTPSYKSKFFIYDCLNHSLEYTSPEKTGYGYVTVADIDGDTKSEIMVTSGSGGDRLLEVYGSTDAYVEETCGTGRAELRSIAVPNPTCRSVVLLFNTPTPRAEFVLVTDVSGRVVRHLARGNGDSLVSWDCMDDWSMPVPSGTYVYSCAEQSGRVEVVR